MVEYIPALCLLRWTRGALVLYSRDRTIQEKWLVWSSIALETRGPKTRVFIRVRHPFFYGATWRIFALDLSGVTMLSDSQCVKTFKSLGNNGFKPEIDARLSWPESPLYSYQSQRIHSFRIVVALGRNRTVSAFGHRFKWHEGHCCIKHKKTLFLVHFQSACFETCTIQTDLKNRSS